MLWDKYPPRQLYTTIHYSIDLMTGSSDDYNVWVTLENGETWELMTLIDELADTRFNGDMFHPELDELWDLFDKAEATVAN